MNSKHKMPIVAQPAERPIPLTPELVARLENVMQQAFEDHDRAVRDGLCLDCMKRPVFVKDDRAYQFCATCATRRIFQFAESEDDDE